ncbi:MAG: hypothetical protein AAFY76_01190 [Cyanobacteria bacterium J06649_11]
MIDLNAFHELLKRLANSLDDNSDKDIFKQAISLWCHNLQIEPTEKREEFSIYATKSIEPWIVSIKIKNGIFSKKMNKIMKNNYPADHRLILTIAFVCVGISLLLFVISQSLKISLRDFEEEKTDHVTGGSLAENNLKGWFLMLVVSAKTKELLETLRAGAELTVENCEDLYRNTKFLKVVREKDYLESYFLDARGKGKSTDSEYDICLVRIKIKDKDLGFDEHVEAQIDRYNSFRRLPAMYETIEISSPLSSEICENKGFYNR